MSKNILIISDRFSNGGLETHILTYAKALKDDGNRVFLMSKFENDTEYIDAIFDEKYDIHFDSNDNINDLFYQVDKIKDIIKRKNIDIVHTHPFLGIIPAFIAIQKLNIPLFITLHGPISIRHGYGVVYDFLIRVVIFNYSNVFVVSQELKSLSLLPGYNDDFIYLPNPVDTKKYKKLNSNQNIYDRWAIVSRLDDDKINSIKSCLDFAIKCGIKQVDIYGDGNNRDILVRYIDSLVNKTKIIFKSFSTKLEEDLANNYSLVVGMGRVVLEAGALNIPVLLVGYDGIKGLVDKDKLLEASWSNFSGRGLENKSEVLLKKEFDKLKKDSSNYNLKTLIYEKFSLNSIFPKYMKFINDTKTKPFPYLLEMENIFKSFSDDKIPYLNNLKLLSSCSILLKEQFDISTIIRKCLATIEYEWSLDKINQKEQQLQQNEQQLQQNEQQLQEQQNLLLQKDDLIESKNQELNSIYNSNFWKVASKYYALKEKPIMIPFVKVGRNLKKVGLLNAVKKTLDKSSDEIQKIKNQKRHIEELANILQKHKDKTIVIFPILIDWNIPLFQRPQHLAKNMAKHNILYFYCTANWTYDSVDGFKEVSDGCYITNRFDLVNNIQNRKVYYDTSSTDVLDDWKTISDRLDKGAGIIYQYIDEISVDLTGYKIPEKTWEKHHKILEDERCIVIPSATKLENDVKEHRSKNYKLVTNGVEIEHFSKDISYDEYPDEMKSIADKKKPIIGYFGAFATWFDYDLVLKLAKEREDLEIVLLGWDYDGSIKKAGFEKFENITVLGPIQYPKLPHYAACFDISVIPFMINDITESTSPIKLFEYMAMGKPIVTTDMPECRKYDSVLIGKSHEDFMQKIEEALLLCDDIEYKKILKKEADENSWESKAKDIAELVDGR